MEKGIALALSLLLFLGLLLLVNLDVVLAGEVLQGLGIGEMLVFLEETHHVARLAAAKAFEDALGRRDIE